MLYDDEAQSSSTLKISKPINRYLEIELKYKLSWADLPRRFGDSSLTYFRQLAMMGITAKF